MILVTGAQGLIGRHLSARLEAEGHDVRRFDLRRSASEDIRDTRALVQALDGVSGVVHLAAVSRVIWGERDPGLCAATNVAALEQLVKSCAASSARPWLIFASSREVYGQADRFPVREDAAKMPLNAYARSKVAGEAIVESAASAGLLANICRFSSVYGCPQDYPDRVVPAFALAAATGGTVRVEGSGNIFDFTHIDDAIDGLFRLVLATMRAERFAPIHFVTGQGTTLGELAQLSARHARAPVTIGEAPARSFDVCAFIGDPGRALALLGWQPQTSIADGFPCLVHEFAERAGWPQARNQAVAGGGLRKGKWLPGTDSNRRPIG